MEVLTDKSQINPALIQKVAVSHQDMGRMNKSRLEITGSFTWNWWLRYSVRFKCELYITGDTMRKFITDLPNNPVIKLTDVNGYEYTINGLRTYFGLRIAGDMENVTTITMTSSGHISKSAFNKILIQGQE